MKDSTVKPPRPGGFWGSLERISRTLSIASIPVVLAGTGWIIQRQIQNQTVSRDYVQLAVAILKEPETEKIPQAMRYWAVDLLNDNSPTKLSPDVAEQLRSGASQLPKTFNVTPSTSSSSPAIQAPDPSTTPSSREKAIDMELQGFNAIAKKDFDGALQAFSNAETLWPDYHNVAEIRTLLTTNQSSLSSADDKVRAKAWTAFYRQLLTGKLMWGMSASTMNGLRESISGR